MAQSNDLTIVDKITVLKHLVNGHDTEWVVMATALTAEQVQAIAETYGPDIDKMGWAIDELTADLDRIRASRPRTNGKAATVRRSVGDPRPVSRVARPVKTAADTLIHAASESSKARTRKLGVKIAGLLGDLSARLEAERQEAEAQAAEAAADAERQERIKQLEAQKAKVDKELRALRCRTRSTKTAPPLGAPAPVVREWAKENNIECPTHGKVPNRVRDQYDAAHVAA